MKGLILKDLYAMKGFGRQYGMIMAFMLIWAVFMKQASFLYVYAALLGTTMILSLISLDEAVSFNRFALTMPVNVEALIKEKYLIFIITTGIGTVVSFLLINLSKMIASFQISKHNWYIKEFNWRELMLVLLTFVMGASIALPVIFKRGAEKGRYAYMAIMLGMCAIIFVGAKMAEKYHISFEWMEKVSGVLYGMIFIAAFIIILVISYLISVRMVKNKQW